MNKAKPFTTEQLFDQVESFINESSELLEADKLIELGGLDHQVMSLCETILHLSQEERLKYNQRLQQLLGDLQKLGENLVKRRDIVAEEIRGLGQHKKATTAYRVTESIDSYNPNKEE